MIGKNIFDLLKSQKQEDKTLLSPQFQLMYALIGLIVALLALDAPQHIIRVCVGLFVFHWLLLLGLSIYCLFFNQESLRSERFILRKLKLTKVKQGKKRKAA